MTQSAQPISVPSSLQSTVRAVRRRELGVALVRAVLWGAGALLAAMLLAMCLDGLLTLFSPAWRAGLTYAALAASALAALAGLVRVGLLRWRMAQVALEIDLAVPQLEERWSTVTELAASRDAPAFRGDPALLQRVSQEADRLRGLVHPNRVVSTRPLRRAALCLAVPALILAVSVAGSHRARVLLQRFLHPSADITLTQIRSLTGSPAVARHEPLRLEAALSGAPRETAILMLRTADGEEHAIDLPRQGSGGADFSYAFRAVSESFEYRFRAGDGQTPWHRVTVVPRPELGEVRLRVTAPDYSQIPAQEYDTLPRTLRALEGSTMELRCRAATAVERIQIDTGSAGTIDLTPAGDGWFSHTSELRETLQFRVEAVGQGGLKNLAPPVCRITVYPDREPRVWIRSPDSDILAPPDDTIAVHYEAQDDFGILGLELAVTISREGEQPRTFLKSLDPDPNLPPPLQMAGAVNLDLQALQVKHGDRVEYVLRARDAVQSTQGDTRGGTQGDPQDPTDLTQQNPNQGGPQDPNAVGNQGSQSGQNGNPQLSPSGQSNASGDPQDANSQGGQPGNPQDPNSRSGQSGSPSDPNSRSGQSGSPSDPNSRSGQSGSPSDPNSGNSQSGNPQDPNSSSGGQSSSPSDPNSGSSGSQSSSPSDPNSGGSSCPPGGEQDPNSSSTDPNSRDSQTSGGERDPQDPQAPENSPPPNDMQMRSLPGGKPPRAESPKHRIQIDEWAQHNDAQKREKLRLDIARYLKALDTELAAAEEATTALHTAVPSLPKWTAEQGTLLKGGRKRLQSAAKLIEELKHKAANTPYAMISLQLEDIGISDVVPAAENLDAAGKLTKSPAEMAEPLTQALFHIRRARSKLVELTKAYERIANEEKRADDLEHIAKMHRILVEDMNAFLQAQRNRINPRTGKMVEVDDEFAKAVQKYYEDLRRLMEELARLLAEDPELMRRFMAMQRQSADTLRDQLTLLARRQQALLADTAAWQSADTPEKRKPLLDKHARDIATEQAQLAQAASQLYDNAVVWRPRQSTLAIEPTDAMAALAKSVAQHAGELAATLPADPNKALELSEKLLEEMRLLGTAADTVAFSDPNDGEVAIYADRRVRETLRMLREQEALVARLQALETEDFAAIATAQLILLEEDTAVLAWKLLDVAYNLADADPPIPTKADDLQRLVKEDIAKLHSETASALHEGKLDDAHRIQQSTVDAFALAEQIFDDLLTLLEERMRGAQPPIAPDLEAILRMLQHERDAAELLGLAGVRLNIQVMQDWMPNNPGEGGGMGGGSGAGSGAGSAMAAASALAQQTGQNAQNLAQSIRNKLDAWKRVELQTWEKTLVEARRKKWNLFVSRLRDGLKQGRSADPPEQYRRAIDDYYRRLADTVETDPDARGE